LEIRALLLFAVRNRRFRAGRRKVFFSRGLIASGRVRDVAAAARTASRDARAIATEAFFTLFFSMRVFVRACGCASVGRTRTTAGP